MIVGIGGLVHEANAFAPASTMDDVVVIPPEKMLRAFDGTSTEISGFLATVHDDDVVPLGFAYGESGGMLDDDTARTLAAGLVDRAGAARPDLVLLALHGSMATPGIDDVEGLLLAQLRLRLGEGCVIAATLDWHCSITPAMVAAADLLVGYRTYPHVDQHQRAATAARVARRVATGEVSPTAAWVHPPMIVAGPATSHLRRPMSEVLTEADDIVARYPSVLDWSVCPGFARSDVPLAGSQVYVATDSDQPQADVCARELAAVLWRRRHDFLAELVSIEDAIDAVRRSSDAGRRDGPVVLADQGDNPGGGASANSTVLVDALLTAGVHGGVVCSHWDPGAVADARRVGAGGHFDWRGRRAEVLHLAEGKYTMRSMTHNGVRRDVGPVATLALDGIRIIATTTRVQNEDLEFVELAGVDPAAATVLVVKSNAHFRAAFGPIASEIIDVDTPGLSTPHLARLPFRRIDRPIFPLDDLDWSPWK